MGNHNSGRRPQPTKLTILRGNPSKKRLNPAEPIPPAGDAVRPGDMSAPGAAMWVELAPMALAMGLLTQADVRAFATLCELQASLTRAAATSGQPEHDERLVRDTSHALRPYLDMFGMSPQSRTRLSVPKREAAEPTSKWAGVLK